MGKPMSEQMQAVAARYEKATGKKFDQKTNADHIRSMSDDELTYLLHDYYCEGHADGLYHIYDAMPISDVREWLKQPYGGDT